MNRFDAVVIGAGLSGLTAAWALHQKGKSVCVLEASSHVGGLIQTHTENGFTFETGPNTFPSTAKEINELCEALALQPVSAQSAHRRFLYLKQKLMALPEKPNQAITSPCLSLMGKLRILLEPFQSKTRVQDTSIQDFFNHRIGQELTNNLVDPFISGIYAGDIAQLSLPAVFPRVWAWEQEAGSFIKGVFLSQKGKAKKRDKMQLLSFENGLQTLVNALASTLPLNTIQLEHTVSHIQAEKQEYQVVTQKGDVYFSDSLIIATPAYMSAELLQAMLPTVSEALRQIPYQGLAVVHTGFNQDDIPHALDGFGFLVPRREKLPLLGSIWASSLFASRAPQGQVLLSNFIGGAHQPEIAEWPAEKIEALVLENLRQVFKTQPLQPNFSKVFRYAKAIPQYTLGHLHRIETIESGLRALPGLALCGNYLHGISLNECVKSGLNAVKNIL